MSDSSELKEQVYFAPETDGRDQRVNDGRDEALLNLEDNMNPGLDLIGCHQIEANDER